MRIAVALSISHVRHAIEHRAFLDLSHLGSSLASHLPGKHSHFLICQNSLVYQTGLNFLSSINRVKDLVEVLEHRYLIISHIW